MKTKIIKISKDRIQYGDDSITSQFSWLFIGVISGFFLYYSAIQILPIFTNPMLVTLASLFGLISCVYILLGHSIQPVDALRGTIDRNRKTEKKELCQHIP
jgi:hypothetical protein